ncbi:TPA: glycosyltransferase [Streptococcus agalactiae]|nr:glycosyltransferase [Streptococcus agalactiae]
MNYSIIMSVYNEPLNYVRDSVESILNQTLTDFEFIIVIDNPSRGDLKQFLTEYSVVDNRIKILLNEENIGLASSLNKAVKISKGEYIFRMDADDISYPSRFDKQIRFMEENSLDFSATLIELIDQKGNLVYKQRESNKIYLTNDIRKMLLNRSILAHPTWCVKKKVFDKLMGYRDLVPVEDYDFAIRGALADFKIGLLNKVLLQYRLNENGISQTNKFKQYIYSAILQDFYKEKSYIDITKITNYFQEYVIKKRYTKSPLVRRLLINDINILVLKLFGGEKQSD